MRKMLLAALSRVLQGPAAAAAAGRTVSAAVTRPAGTRRTNGPNGRPPAPPRRGGEGGGEGGRGRYRLSRARGTGPVGSGGAGLGPVDGPGCRGGVTGLSFRNSPAVTAGGPVAWFPR